MAIEIGNSPESWGVLGPSDPDQIPWSRFLDEVADAGYYWIELAPYGYLPTGPARLQTELENRGLKLSAGLAIARLEDPASWPGLEEQIVRVGELLAPLGARYLFLVDSIYSSDSSRVFTLQNCWTATYGNI